MMMTYMQSNLAFAGGIQELSFDELESVVGGTQPKGGDGSKIPSGGDGSPPSRGRVVGTFDQKTRKLELRCADGQDLIVTRDGDKTTYTCPAPR
jgi:hypothetical protein